MDDNIFLDMKEIHKTEYILNIWKVVSTYSSILVIGTSDIVQMYIIILYGNMFPVTRCSAVESWKTSVHLCGVRKIQGPDSFLATTLCSFLNFSILEGY